MYHTSGGNGGEVFLEITKVGECVAVKAGRTGITGIRTAGSVIFPNNNYNDGLGEEFSRKKIIF